MSSFFEYYYLDSKSGHLLMNSSLKTGPLILAPFFDLFKRGDLDIPTKGVDLKKVVKNSNGPSC